MTFYSPFLLVFAVPAVAFAVLVGVPRFRMEQRARALLARHPDAEHTSVYLELRSVLAVGKRREIHAEIAKMQQQGWTFLRMREASPSLTTRSWGGGLTLHFIRTAD